jgi:hypothetical protein
MSWLNVENCNGKTGYLGKDIMGSVRGIADGYGVMEGMSMTCLGYCMRLKIFLLFLGMICLLYPADGEVTQAELDNFKLIFHGGNEVFPFGNLMTLGGKPFDSFIIKGRYALITLWSWTLDE